MWALLALPRRVSGTLQEAVARKERSREMQVITVTMIPWVSDQVRPDCLRP